MNLLKYIYVLDSILVICTRLWSFPTLRLFINTVNNFMSSWSDNTNLDCQNVFHLCLFYKHEVSVFHQVWISGIYGPPVCQIGGTFHTEGSQTFKASSVFLRLCLTTSFRTNERFLLQFIEVILSLILTQRSEMYFITFCTSKGLKQLENQFHASNMRCAR